jgi:hypothetical protein
MPARLAEIEAIGQDALLECRRHDRYALLLFRNGVETQQRLTALVAAESECCAFLDLSLEEHDDVLALGISAPGEAGAVLDELGETFARGGGADR